jgi:hypothetical protein
MAHDLSYDEVTLDYQELIKALMVGVKHCSIACEKAMGSYQNSYFKGEDECGKAREASYSASKLAEASGDLKIVTYNLYVLIEGLDRHEKKIINGLSDKPKFEDKSKS